MQKLSVAQARQPSLPANLSVCKAGFAPAATPKVASAFWS